MVQLIQSRIGGRQLTTRATQRHAGPAAIPASAGGHAGHMRHLPTLPGARSAPRLHPGPSHAGPLHAAGRSVGTPSPSPSPGGLPPDKNFKLTSLVMLTSLEFMLTGEQLPESPADPPHDLHAARLTPSLP
jgi:hypothetical protein